MSACLSFFLFFLFFLPTYLFSLFSLSLSFSFFVNSLSLIFSILLWGQSPVMASWTALLLGPKSLGDHQDTLCNPFPKSLFIVRELTQWGCFDFFLVNTQDDPVELRCLLFSPHSPFHCVRPYPSVSKNITSICGAIWKYTCLGLSQDLMNQTLQEWGPSIHLFFKVQSAIQPDWKSLISRIDHIYIFFSYFKAFKKILRTEYVPYQKLFFYRGPAKVNF